MVDKNWREIIIEFQKINGSKLYTHLKSNMTNITDINVYASTEKAEEERKNEFYIKFGVSPEKISKHDDLLIMVDLNAKLASRSIKAGLWGINR